jgi:hypothetical protein
MLDSIFDDVLLTTVGTIAITFCCIFGTFLLIGGIWFFMARTKKKKTAALMETGQQGVATVLSLEDTGMRINDDPRVKIGLQVQIEGYPPYQVIKTMTIPLIRMSQVQVGSTVSVLADPNEPQNPDKVGLLLR